MTLNDIRRETAALGFEGDVPDDNIFLFAASRALCEIYTTRAHHDEVRFFKNPPPRGRTAPKISHTGGVDITFEVPRGAYSFSVCGAGYFSVTGEGESTRSETFDTSGAHFCGVLRTGGRITFSGEYSYTVYSLSLYPDFFPRDISEIPSGNAREYDLCKLAPDYLSVAAPPTDGRGAPIPDYEICCERLRLPESYSGEIRLTYRKAPPHLSLSAPDEPLHIARESEHLIPLLTAAYIWLDDDEEKATYYMSLYKEGMATLKVYDTRCQSARVTDTSGWAG